MAAIISSTRATVNSLRIISRDCIDQSIKLFSNFGASVRLPRNHSDDFSWNRDGIFIIKNLSEQECTVRVENIACTGDYWVIRSNFRAARTLRQGEVHSQLLKAGESLTLRSNDACGREAVNL